MKSKRVWLILISLTLNQPAFPADEDDEFSFDVGAYQKKDYTFSGYLELRADQQALNPSSAAYQLGFISLPDRDTLNHQAAGLLFNGSYLRKNWQFSISGQGVGEQDELTTQQSVELYEVIAAYKPKPEQTFEAGKKTLKWGKGYAWNPVGFVERPKDPDEPDLAREGYVMATADIIRSDTGALKTLAFTPVYLPVRNDLNSDYGLPGYDNIGLKLYLLYKDNDIDFVYLSEGSRSQRIGTDFARNLLPHFEIHGEWAYLTDTSKTIVGSGGTVTSKSTAAHQWLLGLRYLTKNETTILAEYYHNQAGYSPTEMQDFFTAVHNADTGGDITLLNQLASLAPKTYLKRTPGQRYLYLRLSNNAPFDWLYFMPALTLITNLDDMSYSVTPEIKYTGYKDYELLLKTSWLRGSALTEFGEKRNQRKIEFRLRYYY